VKLLVLWGIRCFLPLPETKKLFLKNHVFKEKGGAKAYEKGFLQSSYDCQMCAKCGIGICSSA
jgi:hypothetical protein